MRFRFLPLILVTTLALPQTQSAPDGPVIRIDVNLVQVDAVVTDSKGRLVRDLTAADFEILQDGKPQEITNLSWVSTTRTAGRSSPVTRNGTPDDLPTLPPPPLKPADVKRTVALVVDDLGLSFDSIARVRESLKKFVREDMQPGDLVAIVRTGGGMGALQQFTADKRLLYAAIDRVKYNVIGRVGVSSFEPIEPALDAFNPGLNGVIRQGKDAQRRAEAEQGAFLAVGTLGAIRYVIDGLRELPGRKSVILLSEKVGLMNSALVLDGIRSLIDAANRSAAVIYTIDPRGVQYFGLTAADNPRGMTPRQMAAVSFQRSAEVFRSQDGLALLADQTGGLFLHNDNDVSSLVRKAMEDSEGFYLIGYHPDEGTFSHAGGPEFHKIVVRVRRPGLHVRSRKGFFGIPDSKPANQTPRAQIARALTSPFGASGIRVRLTSLFSHEPKAGSFIDVMLHIDGRDLEFTEEPDGWRKAAFEVVAMTFGDNGQAVDTTDKVYTIRARDKTYELALNNGMLYSVDLRVKKPGAYQMRVAVRDVNSGQVGSASQFVEVPDLTKGRLTLSSIRLSEQAPAADPNGSAAVRIFKPGATIKYDFLILNAAHANRPPELDVKTQLFRAGQQVYADQRPMTETKVITDSTELAAEESMRLGADIVRGDYVLQVIVTDKLTREKYRSAVQAMDFEVE